MVLDNLHVKQRAFGEGVVVATTGKYFTVKFATAEKVFVYPDIFEKFLTLSDGTVSDEILADIKVAKDAKQAIEKKKQEENLYSMTRGIVIPGKENANLDSEDEEYRSKQESEEV